MQPPDGRIAKKSGCFSALLYFVTGNCYGLAKGPGVWYKLVVEVLQKKLHHARLRVLLFLLLLLPEPALIDFCHYHPNSGRLDCVMIVHVTLTIFVLGTAGV